MNATNTSQALNSSKPTWWCPVSIYDDEYIAMDYFFIVLSIVLDVLTCPLTILLNALVIMAVKTKPRLQTQHNILLACMAVTDLAVGILQPAFIAKDILTANGKRSYAHCTFYKVIQFLTLRGLSFVSILHLALIGLERYVAMKFSLRYDSIVTEKRLTIAVAFCWLIGTVYSVGKMPGLEKINRAIHLDTLFFSSVGVCVLVIIYCHISVYLVSRHHLIQINSEQVSMEAKRKLQEERKATKTTTIILFGVCLASLPSLSTGLIMQAFPGSFAKRIAKSSVPLTASCYLFNSLFNPVIYCWRNTAMRQAMKQLLKRQENFN